MQTRSHPPFVSTLRSGLTVQEPAVQPQEPAAAAPSLSQQDRPKRPFLSRRNILLAAVFLVVAASIAVGVYLHHEASIVKVATSRAVHENIVSVVSGTGQIKPKTYVNVGATAFGRITHLFVKEGDHVKKGQLIATVESEQPESAVAAQKATIDADRTTVDSYLAAEKTAEAAVAEAQADLVQKKFDIERYEELYKEQLVAKQDYDAKKAAYDVDVATLQQRVAAVAQAKAQTASARSQLAQAEATLQGTNYSLDLTESRAPFDALVTNVPVREGETVVVGIQNAEGSTLMTLADMSVITAEVKVDETDIVNIRMGQPADVTVDALPGIIFHGHVTEVGDQALLRTTGMATSQSTTGTEEAKDFKVVVTLDNTPDNHLDELRPGLSTTARITTANKPGVLGIPIQALVERDPAQEKIYAANQGKLPKASSNAPAPRTHPDFVQGVYVLSDADGTLRANFVPVTTGVTGATDIEVLSGLKNGDEIVTGRYQVLRVLRSGTEVKRDNSAPITPDASS